MSDKLLFTCRVCGVETGTHPLVENEAGETIGVQGVCPEHCEDHEYEYDSFDRNHYCKHCGDIPPDDYFYSDDDVGFGGGYTRGYVPGEPIGTPASAMDGNASNRHNNPAGWDNWVAYCRRCGHD